MSSTGGGSGSRNRSRNRTRRREEHEEDDAQPALQSHDAQAATGTTASAANVGQAAAADGPPLPPSGAQQLSERTAKRRRLACPLDALADVELQLAMQFLDTDGKLSAAKSCRRLSHAARHPFAWKDSRPLVVTARQLAAASSASPLLRVPPLSLHLERGAQTAHLAALAQLPPSADIRELHVDTSVSYVQWWQLLSSPALQSLRLFVNDLQPLATYVLGLLAKLPQLRSLSFQPASAAVLCSLTPAPQLTHLSLQLCFKDLEGMQSVGQCLQLRSLRLASWADSAHGFRELFTTTPSPQQRLERLELKGFLAQPNDYWHIQVPSAEEMCGGLAAMRHLTELRLQNTYEIDALLACLHSAPALRLLAVELGARHPGRAFGSTHPAPEALHSLLERAPQLQVRLLLAPSVEEWLESARRRHLDTVALRADFVQQWRNLRRNFGDMPRVAIADPNG